jgi:hypothetical protein
MAKISIEWTDKTLTTLRLRDHKGGDPSEWPADLRVRQWPEGAR